MAQQLENPPARSGAARAGAGPLGWEDPLEEGLATHPRVLAWESPGQAPVHGVAESGMTE